MRATGTPDSAKWYSAPPFWLPVLTPRAAITRSTRRQTAGLLPSGSLPLTSPTSTNPKGAMRWTGQTASSTRK